MTRNLRLPFAAVPLFLLFCFFMIVSGRLGAMPLFINELHYDNGGADSNEGVELAGQAGTNLQGWKLLFYNGGNGATYGGLELSGIISNEQNGFGALAFRFAGIQNGAPDAVALVDAANQVQQFISYEGSFEALSGAAKGLLSDDIGVAESAQTPQGTSLQLTGFGRTPADFQWSAAAASFGRVNNGQQFLEAAVEPVKIPVSSSAVLLALGLVMIYRRSIKPGG